MAGDAELEVHIHAKTFASDNGASRLILEHIDFNARCGEVLALVGPSGIGKSTVLRIVLGLDQDFQGRVHLPRGRVGVMFQEPRLLPWLTVAENLRLVCAGREQPPELAALLKAALLPEVENLLPRQLSLGMARRVAFARALAIDPQTLILDEPFSSLDRQLASRMAATISECASQRDALVLLSTHDLDTALQLAGRILVLSGSPATLAADFAVPPTEAGSALRRELLTRFPFLGLTPPGASDEVGHFVW
jgi:NitT/TauT family transport system ATP-binding protein